MDEVEIKKDAINNKSVKNIQPQNHTLNSRAPVPDAARRRTIKLVTQLFGERMYITNASGCSSAYGGSTPASPYCTDKRGYEPSWAMSLFEDNAEYAYGYLLGQDTIKNSWLTR